VLRSSIVAAVFIFCAFAPSSFVQARPYNLGHTAKAEEIRALDISVSPSGAGLPPGSGSATEGHSIYALRCAACHGGKGEGVAPYPPLAGGQGTLKTDKPLLTVGSYWPCATTVWDYIHRAMPADQPGSLSESEIYSLTAFVLALNGLVKEDDVLDAKTLPRVTMPNRDGFVADPRPDVPPRH
jgi:mono/diheme cytochrome c family protein